MHTGNRDLIKQINHSIALNLIKSRGPLSRTDIARLSGLSPSTISGLTDRLLASGFIETSEKTRSFRAGMNRIAQATGRDTREGRGLRPDPISRSSSPRTEVGRKSGGRQ